MGRAFIFGSKFITPKPIRFYYDPIIIFPIVSLTHTNFLYFNKLYHLKYYFRNPEFCVAVIQSVMTFWCEWIRKGVKIEKLNYSSGEFAWKFVMFYWCFVIFGRTIGTFYRFTHLDVPRQIVFNNLQMYFEDFLLFYNEKMYNILFIAYTC